MPASSLILLTLISFPTWTLILTDSNLQKILNHDIHHRHTYQMVKYLTHVRIISHPRQLSKYNFKMLA